MTHYCSVCSIIDVLFHSFLMRKQPVNEELQKLQNYIRRFCPELPDVKFSNTRYRNLTEKELEKELKKYMKTIRKMAEMDDWVN